MSRNSFYFPGVSPGAFASLCDRLCHPASGRFFLFNVWRMTDSFVVMDSVSFFCSDR